MANGNFDLNYEYIKITIAREKWCNWFENSRSKSIIIDGITIQTFKQAMDYAQSEVSMCIIGEYANDIRAASTRYSEKYKISYENVLLFMMREDAKLLGKVTAAISTIPNFASYGEEIINSFPLSMMNDLTNYPNMVRFRASKKVIAFTRECFNAYMEGYLPLVTGNYKKPVVLRF